jgi:hypothetical protein
MNSEVNLGTDLIDLDDGKQSTVVLIKIRNLDYDAHQGKICWNLSD